MTQALDELFSARQLKRDPDTLAAWGRDWTTSYEVAPSAVVFPEAVDQVVELVRLANSEGIAMLAAGEASRRSK